MTLPLHSMPRPLAGAPQPIARPSLVSDALAVSVRPRRATTPRASRARTTAIARAVDDRTSVFDFYLADLERYPLLSRDEERTLGEQIVALGQRVVTVPELRGKTTVPVEKPIMDLTGDQIADLVMRLEATAATATVADVALRAHFLLREQAVQKLTVHNLRFGISKAKKYKGLGVPLADLVSAANEGLMHAARKFDPSQGRFSTYSGWWIAQYLLKALAEQGRVLRVPTWVQCDVRKLAKVQLSMTEKLGRQPTSAELAVELGLKVPKIEALMVFLSGAVSLNESAGGRGDASNETTLGEMLIGSEPLTASLSTATRADEQDAHDAMTRVLGSLEVREQEIVRCYYGFETGTAMTFQAIGVRMNLSRERVRQMCRDAVATLQVNGQADVLRDYWDDLGAGD